MCRVSDEQGPLLLVVEDDPLVREVLDRALSAHGYRVMEAENGREALACLAAGVRPSLILLDLFMPEMNGWDFLAAMQREGRWREIPVLVVSGAPHAPIVPGISAVLPKPVELEMLLLRTSQLCAGGEEPAYS
jgi:CheY-like chemotaxis protein